MWFLSIFSSFFAFLLPKKTTAATTTRAPISTGINNTDVVILAKTCWGEARGEGVTGMKAVAFVILNRLAVSRARGGYWWGNNVTQICLYPSQFSCWNSNDPNRAKLNSVTASDAQFAQALQIAKDAIAGRLGADITKGATHYHTTAVKPKWAQTTAYVGTIGTHKFYKEVA